MKIMFYVQNISTYMNFGGYRGTNMVHRTFLFIIKIKRMKIKIKNLRGDVVVHTILSRIFLKISF